MKGGYAPRRTLWTDIANIYSRAYGRWDRGIRAQEDWAEIVGLIFALIVCGALLVGALGLMELAR